MSGSTFSTVTTRAPGDARTLYAGPAQSPSNATSSATPSAASLASDALASGTLVQISDAAKAAASTANSASSSAAPTLKDRVDALYQQAKDAGTFITFDSSKGGV